MGRHRVQRPLEAVLQVHIKPSERGVRCPVSGVQASRTAPIRAANYPAIGKKKKKAHSRQAC